MTRKRFSKRLRTESMSKTHGNLYLLPDSVNMGIILLLVIPPTWISLSLSLSLSLPVLQGDFPFAQADLLCSYASLQKRGVRTELRERESKAQSVIKRRKMMTVSGTDEIKKDPCVRKRMVRARGERDFNEYMAVFLCCIQ